MRGGAYADVVVFDPETSDKVAFATADKARSEWVLGIRGKVRDRGTKDDGSSLRNPRLATGAIEVIALEATIFNKAETPPFEIEDQISTGEDKRLEYRYLDLRRAPVRARARVPGGPRPCARPRRCRCRAASTRSRW